MLPDAALSPLSSFILPPKRIVWQSATGVAHAETLLDNRRGQAVLAEPRPPMVLRAGRNSGGVLIDFGDEIAGSIELFTPIREDKVPPTLRIRFGESAGEAMVELDDRGAQNDHAVRDQTIKLPWLGRITVGQSGFRFVRLDAVDPACEVRLTAVRAIASLRAIPYVGSFRCSDARLNRIWQAGAWTVHLNMQDYLWDGVKRDRLVWVGDMHPEVAVINAVFGAHDIVPRSLDLTREVTPVDQWMNGISAYSMWWVLIHEEWYRHHGDLAYLRAQKGYLVKLLRRLVTFVGADGQEKLDGFRFVDWPTSADAVAVHEGLQALTAMTLDSGARLMTTLGDRAVAALCRKAAARLRRHVPAVSGRKTPAAFSALAGLRDPGAVAAELECNGPQDLSAFCGFYVLKALGTAGRTSTALDFIRRYWGGMLDAGATTFWEDFDLDWTKEAGRIDELTPAGKKDLHGDFGAHCYVGFRRSLCHGWAGGPTAFLSEHVLGISPAAPGFKRVKIAPQLGHLKWAEGTYPTPRGAISVRHERRKDGSIKTTMTLPKGVALDRKSRAPTA